MEHLLQWLFFSDREISIFQFIFSEYLNHDIDSFTPREAYDLALVGNNTQFQMRILKSRISGEALHEEDIESNDTWIIMLLKYNGLTEFVIRKFLEKFDKQSELKKYEYTTEVMNSYFSLSVEDKVPDPKAIKLLNKIINKHAK